jgi:hypothetical protein
VVSDEQNPRRSGRKRGHNKGIAKARKERRREEALWRNARTPDERRRVFREGPADKRGKRAAQDA